MNRETVAAILGVPILLLLVIGCEDSSVDPESKPDRVRLVGANSPMDAVERGIDALPDLDAILIEWEPVSDPGVEKFEIYRGEDADSRFFPVGRAEAADTSWIDEEVDIHQRYYYFVYAVDRDDVRSEPSDTLFYTLLEKPINLNPSGEIESTLPELQWMDPNNADQYVVKVFDPVEDRMIWISRVQSEYGERHGTTFNHDGSASQGELSHGMEYFWRVDVVGPETASGSESPWIPIRIQ